MRIFSLTSHLLCRDSEQNSLKSLSFTARARNYEFTCFRITDEKGRVLAQTDYKLFSARFTEHIRFVPNTQPRMAETEVESIFSHLDMKRNEMAHWIIIVEEAHTFKNVPAFAKFLYGSRHVVRKMIAVTPQTDAFQGLETLMAFH